MAISRIDADTRTAAKAVFYRVISKNPATLEQIAAGIAPTRPTINRYDPRMNPISSEESSGRKLKQIRYLIPSFQRNEGYDPAQLSRRKEPPLSESGHLR